mgnify:CR=1 FL=1
MVSIKQLAKNLPWQPVYGTPPRAVWKYELEAFGMVLEVTERNGRWDWELLDPIECEILDCGDCATEIAAKCAILTALFGRFK